MPAPMLGEEVAEQMGWSVAKVYRIKGDKVRVLPRDAQRLLRLYGIGGEQAEVVMELARLARARTGSTTTPAPSPSGSSSTSASKPPPAPCRNTAPS